MTPVIKPLRAEHATRVREIYNHAVRHTDATLDTEEKTETDIASWCASHDGRYPAVGAEFEGVLVGYGTLSPFATRGGYLASAEISVYVAPDWQGKGVGSALGEWLTSHAECQNMSTVLALITSTNERSLRLFRSLGYSDNGVLERVGYKRGRLVDLRVCQRLFPFDPARHDARVAQLGDKEIPV